MEPQHVHSKLITVDVLKFQIIVSCQKGIDKQRRPRPGPEVIKLFHAELS